KDFKVKGKATGYKAFWEKKPENIITEEDFCTSVCSGNIGSGRSSAGSCLVEFYVDSGQYANYEPVVCENGCENGVCKAVVCGNTGTPVCGNGKLETGEECDDGNTKSGDGCTAGCKKESTQINPTSSSTATLMQNNIKYRLSYQPGQIRYFYFIENSNKGIGNKNPLSIAIEDPSQDTGMYNIDAVARYAGTMCDDTKKPTMADLAEIKKHTPGYEPGVNGLYYSLAMTGFETITITDHPEGCYYVMVVNVDTHADESTIYYADFDSKM
ncbi:MAG: myxococcus cysteine-rich repeat containing protein, partial [Parcubacteria group bacterium]